MFFSFFEIHRAVRNDDDEVADVYLMSCCAVDSDDARTAFTFDSVSAETFAICDVININTFVFNDVSCI